MVMVHMHGYVLKNNFESSLKQCIEIDGVTHEQPKYIRIMDEN